MLKLVLDGLKAYGQSDQERRYPECCLHVQRQVLMLLPDLSLLRLFRGLELELLQVLAEEDHACGETQHEHSVGDAILQRRRQRHLCVIWQTEKIDPALDPGIKAVASQ